MNSPVAHAEMSGKGRRRLWLGLLGFVAVFILMLILVSILFSTESGSRWAVNRINGIVTSEASSLHIERIEGTLLWGLRLSGIDYRNNDNTVTIEQLSSRWDLLPLLYRQFNLESLHISGLTAAWQAPADDGDQSDPFAFLPLPVSIRLNDVQLSDSQIIYDEEQYPVDSLQFSALLSGDRLELEQLALQGLALGDGVIDISSQISLQLVEALPVEARVRWSYLGPIHDQIDSASGLLHASGTIDSALVEHQLEAPVRVHSTGKLVTGLTDPDSGTETALAVDFIHTLQQQTLPIDVVSGLQFDGFSVHTAGGFNDLLISGNGILSSASLPAVDLHMETRLLGDLLYIDSVTLDTSTGGLAGNGLISWESGLAADFDYTLTEENPANWYAAMPVGLELSGLASSGNIRLRTEAGVLAGSASIDTLEGVLNDYELSGAGQLLIDGDHLSITGFSLSSSENSISVSGAVGDTLDLQFNLAAPVVEHLYEGAQGSVAASGSITGSRDVPRLTIEAEAQNLVVGTTGISRINLQGSYSPESTQLRLQVSEASLGTTQNSLQLHSLRSELSGRPEDHQLQLGLDSNFGEAAVRLTGGLDDDVWNGSLQSGRIDSLAGFWQLQRTVALQLSREHIAVQQHCWLQQRGPGGSLCLEADWTPRQISAMAELSSYPLAVLNTVTVADAINAALEGAGPVSFPDLSLPLQLPPNLAIRGELNGTLQLSGSPADPASLELQAFLGTGPGDLFVRFETLLDAPVADGPTPQPLVTLEQFSWPGLTVQIRRVNSNWDATGNFTFAQQDIDGSGIMMQGSASAGVQMDANETIEGRLDLAFDDLNFIEAFVPQLQNTQGSLHSAIHVAGTLQQPQFGGNLALEEAQTDIPSLGLQLRNVEAGLRSNDGETLSLTGELQSGGGSLRFDSTLINPMQDSRELQLDIEGENFQLANLPQLSLSVSPQLTVSASDSGIVVDGDLLIPELNIEIESLPESAVDVSGDTVIVGQSVDEPEVRNAALGDRGILGDIPISGNIQLILGDDVQFTGFGLTAQIDGALDINQRPTGSPLTYGELSIVEGSYTTYGQTLNIEHGKLLFFGTYDNPGLDIRAVREAENVKVGVQMNGTLRNIESELFSTPPLPDGEIIAVLVTGRPLSEIGNQDGNALVGAITTLGINQGQSLTNQIRNQLGLDTLTIASRGDTSDSSVMLGKYLTPRIFIRYAVGLFETQSELAIEYSISDRVKLEATSGQDQSIDLTYTRER